MTAKPKVVHVITRLLRGGTEENTMLCCKAQVASGYEVALAHGNSVSDDYWAGQASGIDLVAVPSLVHPIAPLADIRAVAELTATFRRSAPSVVHTHQSKAGIVGRLAGRLAGVKVVVHTVHIIPFTNVSRAKQLLYVWSEKFAARFCDALIFVSEGARAEYARHNIGTNVPTFVIPSGMEISRFQRHSGVLQSPDARRLAADHADEVKVLYLSSFEERKRHLGLIAALDRARDRLEGCHIVLAGEGPLKGDVQALVEKHSLSPYVSILDHCSTPEDLIAISDLCLYASEREGLPRAVIQSLASAKPVVVANLPGIEEIVADDNNGIITPADDLDVLVQTILRLRDQRTLLDRLTAGAVKTDTSRWDAGVMTSQVDAVYQDMLAAKAS